LATRNIIFVFEYGGLTVCHLGGLNHVPSRSQIEAMGAIDVLLTPVGGDDLISPAQAAEVISMLEPRLVIPMHYHTPPCNVKLPRANAFLKEMGANNVESAEILQVSRSTLPQETQVVLLSPRQ
jgi:L-ascorbate metabolism protein UlaG (beta-lactamase superfamily)